MQASFMGFILLFCSEYLVERITSTSLPFVERNGSYFVNLTDYSGSSPTTEEVEYTVNSSLFAVRTCQSYFQPHVTIQYTNIGPFIEGMASGATELEDFIITPDLRGQVQRSSVLCDNIQALVSLLV